MATNKYNIKNKAFTLVEMLVVLSIIAILVVMVVSSFGKVGGTEALDTTTTSIISALNAAKSSAVSSKDASDYGVRIFSNRLISFENSYGTNDSELDFSNLVTVSTSSGVGTDIIFSNVSGKTDSNGTITVTVLSDMTKNETINIYPTGIIEKN